jgi:hypothetical protein
MLEKALYLLICSWNWYVDLDSMLTADSFAIVNPNCSHMSQMPLFSFFFNLVSCSYAGAFETSVCLLGLIRVIFLSHYVFSYGLYLGQVNVPQSLYVLFSFYIFILCLKKNRFIEQSLGYYS